MLGHTKMHKIEVEIEFLKQKCTKSANYSVKRSILHDEFGQNSVSQQLNTGVLDQS